MDWFLSLHHQEMPPRLLLWIWIIEYLYPNHYVNILPRRNNSRKQKAPCDKHDAFRNSFFAWKTSSRPKPPGAAGSMLWGTYLRRRCRTRTDAHGVSCRALTTIKPFPERFAPSFRELMFRQSLRSLPTENNLRIQMKQEWQAPASTDRTFLLLNFNHN